MPASQADRRGSAVPDADTAVAGVRLSHPNKLLYPGDGITKLDLAHYYQQAARWMLPHVENRLLSLLRCPDGKWPEMLLSKASGRRNGMHILTTLPGPREAEDGGIPGPL